MQAVKSFFVLLVTFIGAGFSIMSFNNDVNVPKLFDQIYYLVTGTTSDGFTILELTYSLGMSVGILLFSIILERSALPRIRRRWKWRCGPMRKILR